MKKALIFTIFIGFMKFLHAAGIGHQDIVQTDLNDPSKYTNIRQIHIEFTNNKLKGLEHFSIINPSNLSDSIRNKIGTSLLEGKEPEVIFNIFKTRHVINARIIMKELGYQKYENKNPLILLSYIGDDETIKNTIKDIIDEYMSNTGIL